VSPTEIPETCTRFSDYVFDQLFPRLPVLVLLANSSFMALNLFLPILALKAHMIEMMNITIGKVQKMILTASCAV
jgi:hypothetical protein